MVDICLSHMFKAKFFSVVTSARVFIFEAKVRSQILKVILHMKMLMNLADNDNVLKFTIRLRSNVEFNHFASKSTILVQSLETGKQC